MRYRRNLYVVYRVVDGKRLIFKNESKESIELDRIGTEIWDLLDGELDLEGIAGVIANRYDVSLQEVLPDVEVFVSDLLAKNMVALLVNADDDV